MKKFTKFLMPAVMLGVMVSCSDEPSSEGKVVTIPELTETQSRIVDSQTDFAFRLFEAVNTERQNNVVSPLIVSMALSMLVNATEDEAHDEIVGVLSPDGGNIDELNALNRLLVTSFPYVDPAATMEISNSVWAQKTFPIEPTFSKVLSDNYAGEIKPLTTDGAANRKTINSFIEQNTRGLFKDFISRDVVSPLFLNTCYFKAPWEAEKITEAKMVFRNSDGDTPLVDAFKMMAYGFTSRDMTVARAAYGNGAYCMTMIMGTGNTAPSITEIAAEWNGWNEVSSWAGAHLTIPEWDFEWKAELCDVLPELGIQKVFRNESVFTPMTSAGLSVNSVFHGARVITNKKGTEAAGVTAIGYGSAGGQETEIMLNRPFVYIISEKATKAILFIGEVDML